MRKKYIWGAGKFKALIKEIGADNIKATTARALYNCLLKHHGKPELAISDHMAKKALNYYKVGRGFYDLSGTAILEKLEKPKKKKGKKFILPQVFYESREWQELRYKAIKLSDGKCQACGINGKETQIHVDHIKPRSKYPELELVLSNLQILCRPCNLGKSNLDETDWRPDEMKERFLNAITE